RDVVQVEESGGGDVRAERGDEGDQKPAPGQPGRPVRTQSTPGGDEEQVYGDRIGPGLPAVLSSGGGEVVEVGEGQCPGNDGLNKHGVHAEGGAGHDGSSCDRAWQG